MPNSAGMVRSCRPEIVTNIWPVFEAHLRAAEGATSCNEHTSIHVEVRTSLIPTSAKEVIHVEVRTPIIFDFCKGE